MPVAGLTFLFLFLPVSVLLSQLLPKRWKDPAVLLCSLLFYAWGDGINLLLLPAVAAVAYFTGKRAAPVQQLKTRRGITGIGICLTLLTGILFKSGAELFTAAPLGGNLVTLGVELPLGFSFFILRMVGYQVDVARGRKSARSLLEFLEYAMFFPLITAGPLLTFGQWRTGGEEPGKGVSLFVWGLAQKLVLADSAFELFHRIVDVDYQDLPVVTAWLALFLGAFAFYFEFTAYLNMGAGLCRLMGVPACPGGSGPFSTGILGRDLRTFHRTLFDWFDGYVYAPLTGIGFARWLGRICCGLGIGLLFGSRANCLLFGLFVGLGLIWEDLSGFPQTRSSPVSWVITLVSLPLGVSLLLFQSFPDWLWFVRSLLGLADNTFFTPYTLTLAYLALPLLLVGVLLCGDWLKRAFLWVSARVTLPLRLFQGVGTLLLFFLSVMMLMENGASNFVYLRM